MTRLIYNAALYLGLPILAPALAWKMARQPAYRAGFFQKLGFFIPRQTQKTIWIHAVSVGETMAALRLARLLARTQSKYRIMFSTSTPTGQEVAKRELAPDANVFYFPFDFPGATRRAAEAVNPAVLALVDTELWPNVIHACAKRGAAVALINGRISGRSFPRYKKYRRWIKPALEDISLVMAQSGRDLERFIEIGVAPQRAMLGGNLKFDQDTATISPEERGSIKKSLGIRPDELVIVLGSVHKGEEEAIGAAMGALRPGRRLVIAPRRIENLDWIDSALRSHGAALVRRSANPIMPLADHTVVPVIDAFGELGKIYSAADVAFVGGSLIDHGGQNPLEPAGRGVPALFGPNMSNFQEASAALTAAEGAWIANSLEEIKRRMESLLSDEPARKLAGEAARNVVEANRGATALAAERILALADG
jgi:3-deoxy-D-manno-octulosonic-acid transferase